MAGSKSQPYLQLYSKSDPSSHSNYLPHLDGLRAIALIGVLLFHFQVPHFQGGFAGVDVFLSLSGFLITRNILRQLSQNKFTLISFYKRRFFRLYPASVATVLFTLCLGFLSFPPDVLSTFGNSAVAAMLFYANVFFNLQAGYFDSAADTKPFLHFWSLSLEEQYYFVWAPLLVLINRFTKRPVVIAEVLVAMLIASFSLALYLDTHFPAFVFFQLPSRIWQFAAGALTAVLTGRETTTATNVRENKNINHQQYTKVEHVQPLQEPDHNILISSSDKNPFDIGFESENFLTQRINKHEVKWVEKENSLQLFQDDEAVSSSAFKKIFQRLSPLAKELLSWCAFLTILGSYFFLPRSASMCLMVPTTISTCIILALGDTFFATHVLSLSFLRSLGHLSYSAYLVHWPIFVFSLHLCNAFGLDEPNIIVMTVVTLGAAMMLRHWVEDPVRRRDRRWVFGVMSVCTFMFAISVIITKGFPSRVGHIDTDVLFRNQADRLLEYCQSYPKNDPRFAKLPYKTCLVGDLGGTRSRYAFIGDSYTMHLVPVLKDVGMRRKEWYVTHWKPQCKFVAENMRDEMTPDKCKRYLDLKWKTVHGLPTNSVIVVGNHWGSNRELSVDKRSRMEDIEMLYKEIVNEGHQLLLIGEPPGVDLTAINKYFACADVSILPLVRWWSKLKGREFRGAAGCADFEVGLQPRGGRMRERKEYNTILPKLMPGAGFVDVVSHLCHENNKTKKSSSCRLPQRDDGVVYDNGYCRGGSHLSINGSYHLRTFYEQQIFNNPSLKANNITDL